MARFLATNKRCCDVALQKANGLSVPNWACCLKRNGARSAPAGGLMLTCRHEAFMSALENRDAQPS